MIDKIRKLLALGNSVNPHEAEVAAKKAHELLIRYNISMKDIQSKSEYVDTGLADKMKQGVEDKYVLSILNQFFFVSAYTNSVRGGIKTIKLYGTPTNVEIATYVYDFLVREFKLLFKEYKKYNKNAQKQSYYMGLYKGLVEVLEAQQVKIQNEVGLVLVRDDMLIRKERGMRTANTRVSTDRDMVQDGISDGRNIKIRKGMEGGSVQSGRYLGA